MREYRKRKEAKQLEDQALALIQKRQVRAFLTAILFVIFSFMSENDEFPLNHNYLEFKGSSCFYFFFYFLSIYPSMYVCIYLSIYLSIYLIVYSSIYLFMYLSVYISMYLCITIPHYLCLFVF